MRAHLCLVLVAGCGPRWQVWADSWKDDDDDDTTTIVTNVPSSGVSTTEVPCETFWVADGEGRVYEVPGYLDFYIPVEAELEFLGPGRHQVLWARAEAKCVMIRVRGLSLSFPLPLANQDVWMDNLDLDRSTVTYTHARGIIVYSSVALNFGKDDIYVEFREGRYWWYVDFPSELNLPVGDTLDIKLEVTLSGPANYGLPFQFAVDGVQDWVLSSSYPLDPELYPTEGVDIGQPLLGSPYLYVGE